MMTNNRDEKNVFELRGSQSKLSCRGLRLTDSGTQGVLDIGDVKHECFKSGFF